MIEKTQGHLNTTKTGSVHALHADVVEVENEEDPETEKGRRNPEGLLLLTYFIPS